MPIVSVHGLFAAPMVGLCPDLPGYGANQQLPASLPDAVQFLRSLIHEPTDIVGHSIGGVIAVLFAARYPDLVHSIVNVEGNFTLKDAFWSMRLGAMSDVEAEAEIGALRADPAAWLSRSGVAVTPDTLQSAVRSLAAPVRTVQAMAKSVVSITSLPQYLETVEAILARGIPMHLIAGEHSRTVWDVPYFLLERAASVQIQPDAGHMLMLNDLAAFTILVEKAVARS